MARVLDEPIVLTEKQQVQRWREQELLRAGFAPDAADVLSRLLDVDLHQAIGLLEAGCERDLAVKILL